MWTVGRCMHSHLRRPYLAATLLLPFLPTLRAHVRVRADSGVVPDGRALHGSGLRSSQFGVWRLAFGFM